MSKDYTAMTKDELIKAMQGRDKLGVSIEQERIAREEAERQAEEDKITGISNFLTDKAAKQLSDNTEVVLSAAGIGFDDLDESAITAIREHNRAKAEEVGQKYIDVKMGKTEYKVRPSYEYC